MASVLPPLPQFGSGTQTHYERDASIAGVFVAQAALTPYATAVVDGHMALTYRELDERSNRFARRLIALGVERGAFVGVAVERSIDLPVALLGILKTGAAYVALDPSYPAERLNLMIRDAAIRFVASDGSSCVADGFAPATLVNVRDTAAAVIADSTAPLATRSTADAPAYVAYTSGSTGRPKGVVVVQRGVVRLVRGADYFDVSAADVFLHFAPLGFDASTFEIWAPLLNGACVAIAPAGTLSLDELGGALQRFGVTTMWLTASLFRTIVASRPGVLGGLRQLLTGGDVVAPDAATRFLEAFPACRLIDGYGPTENTTFSCCYHIESAAAIADGVPIGRPIANSTAYVLDEHLQPVAPGVPGELCVGGDGIASGYLNLPALTAERFVPDPFSAEPGARMYRTGDLARFRADGVLEFLGRLDHQVKIRGFRIELGEIEHVLRAHAAIADAALSVVTLGGDKTLVAHVVITEGASLTEKGVRDYIASSLPAHMMPAYVDFVSNLPAHSSGKLDRVRLTQRAERQTQPKPASLRNPLERTARLRSIAACWAAALGTAGEPDPDANFFDAGGDSLRLLALHARLQRELRVEFGIVDLFEHTTIRKFAAFLNARVA